MKQETNIIMWAFIIFAMFVLFSILMSDTIPESQAIRSSSQQNGRSAPSGHPLMQR